MLLQERGEKRSPPAIIHSDQGSEYDSKDFIDLIESLKIKISMNRKASPWENADVVIRKI